MSENGNVSYSIQRWAVIRLLIATVLSVSASEMMVMLILPADWISSRWVVALLDSVLLAICVFPCLYFFAFRPLTAEIIKRRVAESQKEIAIKQLQKSDRQRQTAQVLAKVGYWEYHPAADQLLWDDQLFAIFGLDPSQDLPLSLDLFLEYVHPEDRAKLREEIEKQLPYREDYRIVLPGDVVKHIREEVQMECADNGRVVKFYGTAQDITEHHTMEDTMRLQSEIVKNIAEGVCLVNCRDLRIVYANPKMEVMFGYAPGEMNGKHISNINALSAEDPGKVVQDIEISLRERGEWQGEALNLRKDGTRFWGYGTIAKFTHVQYGEVYLSLQRDISARKEAEFQKEKVYAELQQSEERLKRAQAIAHVGNWEWDLPQGTMHWDEENARIFGWPAAITPSIDSLFAAIHPEDLESVQRSVNEAMEGTPFDLDFRIRRQDDGMERVIHAKVGVSGDPDGKPARFFGTLQDITERKRAEEALRASQEMFSKAFAISPYAITITRSRDGSFVDVNDAFIALSGLTREEVLGHSTVELGLWVDVAERNQVLSDLGEGRKVTGRECQFRNKTGGIIIALLSAEVILLQKERCILTSINDITERKRAEEALQASEARYRTIIGNTGEGIGFVNPGEQFVFANPAAEEIFGVAPGGLVGKSLDQFVSADHYAVVQRESARRALGEKSVYELEIGQSGGERRHILVTAVPQLNDKNGLMGTYGVFRDITESKRSEEQRVKLEAENLQLQKAESLGRMAGAIAHHFNNQLGVVIGYLELATAELLPGSEGLECIKEAMQASRRASELSGLMLTYLGQSAGKREPLDLSEVFRKSLPLLQAFLSKNVLLQHNLPSPGPPVNANANQLQQVLTNLITNAWEAIGEKRGSIYLSIKTVAATEIPLSNRHPINWQSAGEVYACLEVRDTGCGIPAKDIEKLFDPFFTTKFTGRGLGLSVVLGIVRAHGGAVTVESEMHRGSIFRVFLPLRLSLPE